ncbi:MAG: hypothetical protein ABIJ21_03315 [Nanoarchaeota archaeon]
MNEGRLEKQFQTVKTAILMLEGKKRASKQPLYRETSLGFWGTSNVDDLFVFFSKIHLEEFTHFLDMGSGDGRMVFIAALFTKATGIEIDDELVKESQLLKEQLVKEGIIKNESCTFIKDDFMKHDFSKYDFLMAYYDKLFTLELEQKIEKEFKGDFYLYNNIYTPHFLKKEKIVWIAQMPFIKIATQKKNDTRQSPL